MAAQRYLDRTKFMGALRARGFPSVRHFVNSAGIHRNSMAQYLNHEKGVFTDLFQRVCDELQIDDPLQLLSARPEQSGVLTEAKLKAVLAPIASDNPTIALVLIGSRAAGRAEEHSDWDLGITSGRGGVGTEAYLRVKSDIADATDDFAQSCDVVNLDAAPLWFFDEMDYAPVFLAGNYNSFLYLRGLIDGIAKARENPKGSRAA